MTDGDPVACFVACLFIGTSGAEDEEDAAGLIYRGAAVLYTNEFGELELGMLESAQAAYGQAADIAVLRISGTVAVAAHVTSVPHKGTGNVPPHWVSYSGENTSPPVLGALPGGW